MQAPPRPGLPVIVLASVMALWCVGFAAVNIVFEAADHFAHGRHQEYASALTVMNWFVVALKLLGAAVAILSVARRPRLVTRKVLAVLLWGGFATLAVYVLGGVAEAVAILAGLMGSIDQIDLASVAYLAFFLLAAAGWGVLAVSYSRRHEFGWRSAALGVLGAPIVLGSIFVAVPAILRILGVMPR